MSADIICLEVDFFFQVSDHISLFFRMSAKGKCNSNKYSPFNNKVMKNANVVQDCDRKRIMPSKCDLRKRNKNKIYFSKEKDSRSYSYSS